MQYFARSKIEIRGSAATESSRNLPEECSRSGFYGAGVTGNMILNIVPLLTSLSTLIRPRCS